ncbi:hypothetical protein [Carnobacterium divergens]|uniref:hypothetical protein n=1 Tax=Carnobacterium divergens TaxID=2748 RepID=UPI0039AFFDDC
MNVLVRESATGKEYWDNEAKKNRFVPHGIEPDFEVTTDPETMIHNDLKANVTVNVDMASGEDSTVINVGTIAADTIDPDLESMKVNQLKEYAAANELEIPNEIKTKKEIISFIDSQLFSDDDDEVLPV